MKGPKYIKSRAEEAAIAWKEHLAAGQATSKKTARLRALRLARAAEQSPEVKSNGEKKARENGV